jgi:hypothetical protein
MERRHAPNEFLRIRRPREGMRAREELRRLPRSRYRAMEQHFAATGRAGTRRTRRHFWSRPGEVVPVWPDAGFTPAVPLVVGRGHDVV